MYNLSKACADTDSKKERRSSASSSADNTSTRSPRQREYPPDKKAATTTTTTKSNSKRHTKDTTTATQQQQQSLTTLEEYLEKTGQSPDIPENPSSNTTYWSEAASSKQTRKTSNKTKKEHSSSSSRRRRLDLRSQKQQRESFSKKQQEEGSNDNDESPQPNGPKRTISYGFDAGRPSSVRSLSPIGDDENENYVTSDEEVAELEGSDPIAFGIVAQDLEMDRRGREFFDEAAIGGRGGGGGVDGKVAGDSKSGRPRWLIVAVVVILTIGVVVGVMLGMRGGGDDDDTEGGGSSSMRPSPPSPSPSIAPSELPTTAEFGEATRLLLDVWPDSVAALDDITSPQARAVEWMITYDVIWGGDISRVRPERFLQRFAVVTLYYALGGPDWTDQANFLSPSSHECDWNTPAEGEGLRGIVNCSLFQEPERIEIAQNNLTGTLPEEIAALTDLLSIKLDHNNLSGPIPTSLLSIPTLSFLELSDNRLTGTLPREWDTPQLQTLAVGGNMLGGPLPDHFSPELIHLDVQGNQFTGMIPESYGITMPSLTSALLRENRLTGTVPTSFGQIESLEELSLFENSLSGDLSFLCDGDSISQPNLDVLEADCLGEVTCPCCTFCCDKEGQCVNVRAIWY